MEITLSDVEEKICTLLDQVALGIKTKNNNADASAIVLRFAGGWVRDKLLEIECDDVDVAIDTMTGYDFALAVEAHLKASGAETGLHIAKIAANPDKSKHLETANTKIFGMSIDFVNLRSEEYSADSRIPTMKFGTPLEDALRRDITINALFYNVHTRKGLPDLKDGMVRTPLEPMQTFMDDPLRILRVIRFASRFNYVVHEDIPPCDAFMSKISRERVGVEVDKMLKGPHPVRAVELMREFGMYELVFSKPDSPKSVPLDANQAVVSMTKMQWMMNNCQALLPNGLFPLNGAERRLMFLSAAVIPSHGQTFPDKKTSAPLCKHLVLNSLKLSMHDVDMVAALLGRAENFHDTALENKKQPFTRKSLGFAIRSLGAKPLLSNWPLLALTSLVIQTIKQSHGLDDTNATQLLLEDYQSLFLRVQDLGLLDVYSLKPIIDGREVSSLLNLRPSPQIAEALERVIEWQLEHENGTREECIEWLREQNVAIVSSDLAVHKKPRMH
ncbi:hypothetical protein SmJEL517_g04241 [Synchytrium microbalum]|uniref:Poly A polymerase head domain-containing protein n=1 Tax=Synchytrium microbalum TaxID=1806994 RepID=A0A507BZ61_9FUNG|nr:uncharacterized protein SmJEL517_g04241 [Synchytrium microbalum]TPX32712.1 hypothetical protein SmJEL517_g04241 [Synchytrium microbalum]